MKLNFYSFSKPGVYQTVFHFKTYAWLRYCNFGPSSHVQFRVITESPDTLYDEPAMKPAPRLRDLPRYYHTILGSYKLALMIIEYGVYTNSYAAEYGTE